MSKWSRCCETQLESMFLSATCCKTQYRLAIDSKKLNNKKNRLSLSKGKKRRAIRGVYHSWGLHVRQRKSVALRAESSLCRKFTFLSARRNCNPKNAAAMLFAPTFRTYLRASCCIIPGVTTYDARLWQGFTREFLKGGAGTSEDLLQEIRDAVEELSFGKKVGPPQYRSNP